MKKARELITDQYERGYLTEEKYAAAMQASRSRSERMLDALVSWILRIGIGGR